MRRRLAGLGLVYVQQARVTADPSFYPGVSRARAVAAPPGNDNADALIGVASLSAARHDFEASLGGPRLLARACRMPMPTGSSATPSSSSVGTTGPSLPDDGGYAARPQLARTRVSCARGCSRRRSRRRRRDRPPAASRATRPARRGPASSSANWPSTTETSRLRPNCRRMTDPDFVSNLAGLARVAWARRAAPRRSLATSKSSPPLPEHVIALGDAYAETGDSTAQLASSSTSSASSS